MKHKPDDKLALLFDADYFAFQAAAAANKVCEWNDDGVLFLWGNLEEAKEAFCASIAKYTERNRAFSTAKAVMCFTSDVNWRKDVFAGYKGTRKGKPIVYAELKKWVMENFFSFERHGLEGDDCMGILSTRPSLIGCDRAIIISPDKDFNTIPGEFLWITEGSIREVSPEQADDWHMYQTLMGDSTDEYPGCPGFGPDTARAFLDEPYVAYPEERALKSGPRKGELVTEWKKRPLAEGETLWDAIVSNFRKAGLTEEDALVQARVARILRASDYDFTKKEPILWTPN